MVGRCRRPTTLRALPFVQQVAQAIAEYGDSGPELARSRHCMWLLTNTTSLSLQSCSLELVGCLVRLRRIPAVLLSLTAWVWKRSQRICRYPQLQLFLGRSVATCVGRVPMRSPRRSIQSAWRYWKGSRNFTLVLNVPQLGFSCSRPPTCTTMGNSSSLVSPSTWIEMTPAQSPGPP